MLNHLFFVFGIAAISFLFAYLGASAGIVLGNIRLPILIYFLGSPAGAIGTNLAISSMGALSSSYFYARQGRINYRMMVSIGIPSVIGTVLGTVLLSHFPKHLFEMIVSLVLVDAAYKMSQPRRPQSKSDHQFGLNQKLLIEGFFGFGIGLLSGIVGLMLSSMRLPALIQWLGMDEKEAVGTNLSISLLTGLAGATSSSFLARVDWVLILVAAPATLLGSFLGSKFLAKINSQNLRRLIAWMLWGIGGYMFVQGFVGFLGDRGF